MIAEYEFTRIWGPALRAKKKKKTAQKGQRSGESWKTTEGPT